MDDKLRIEAQVSKVVPLSFFTIKILRKVFPFIPGNTRKTVVSALVLSKLDYCNGLYTGLQEKLLRKLQRVQNAAARLILDIPKFQSVNQESGIYTGS